MTRYPTSSLAGFVAIWGAGIASLVFSLACVAVSMSVSGKQMARVDRRLKATGVGLAAVLPISLAVGVVVGLLAR